MLFPVSSKFSPVFPRHSLSRFRGPFLTGFRVCPRYFSNSPTSLIFRRTVSFRPRRRAAVEKARFCTLNLPCLAFLAKRRFLTVLSRKVYHIYITSMYTAESTGRRMPRARCSAKIRMRNDNATPRLSRLLRGLRTTRALLTWRCKFCVASRRVLAPAERSAFGET